MKARYFLSLFIFVIITACNNNETATISNTHIENSIKKYTEVGVLHNEGLDFVFNRLKSNKTKNSAYQLSIESIITESENFLKSQNTNIVLSRNIDDYQLHFDFNETRNDNPFANLNCLPKEKEYLEDLLNLLYDCQENTEALKNNIRLLEAQIMEEKAIENLEPILYACEVTLYSYEYWIKNLPQWIETFNTNPSRGFWSNLGRAATKTAAVDGCGAFCGAIAGGVGALPGALSTSLLYCTTAFVDSF